MAMKVMSEEEYN